MEGWGARAHSPGLVVARVRSCVLAIVPRWSSRAWLSSFVCIPSSFMCICFPFMGMHCCSWAFVSISGHVASSMGIPLCSWAFILIYERSFVPAHDVSWMRVFDS